MVMYTVRKHVNLYSDIFSLLSSSNTNSNESKRKKMKMTERNEKQLSSIYDCDENRTPEPPCALLHVLISLFLLSSLGSLEHHQLENLQIHAYVLLCSSPESQVTFVVIFLTECRRTCDKHCQSGQRMDKIKMKWFEENHSCSLLAE